MQSYPAICLVFTFGISLKSWSENGSLEREVKPYVKLAEEGFNIIFLTYGDDTDLPFVEQLDKITVIPMSNRNAGKSKPLRLFIMSLFALWTHRQVLSTVSIFKSNQMLGSHLALLASFIFKAKFLLRTGYELYDNVLKRNLKLRYRLITWLISFIGYRASDMVVVSTYRDKCFASERFNVGTSKIVIQPNWIDLELFRPSFVDKTGRDFIAVSRLDPNKNLDEVIRASKLAGVTLDIVGSGEQELILRELVKEIHADVIFHNTIPNSTLPRFLQKFRGFVLCSKFEGNPKVIIEAMACGIPVLGSRVDGISELIIDGKTGYLSELDAASIAQKMNELLTSPQSNKRLTQAATQKVIETNSLDTFLANEKLRYKKLLY